MQRIDTTVARLAGFKLLPYALIVAAIMLAMLCGIASDRVLAAPGAVAGQPEQSTPQGATDAPGPDQPPVGTGQIPGNEGVITPPPTGDKAMETIVPSPSPGSDKDVIPPPGTPGGDQSVEPK